MNNTVRIIGTAIVTLAIIYLLNPDSLRYILNFFIKGKRIYTPAVIRFALSAVFFYAASQCKIPWLITILAAIFLIDAMIILLMKLENLKNIIRWFTRQPDATLRTTALLTLAVGVLIIYAA